MGATRRYGGLRIGLIGASGHFSRPLEIIARRPELELVAVAPAHPAERLDRVQRHAAFTPDTRTLSSADELLDALELDAVIVNPPYGLNARYITAAVRRGIAVYAEKPYATTLDALAALQEALKERPTPVVGMFELRAHPVVATAARLVNSGAIGLPVGAFGQKTYKFNAATRPGWYAEPELYGGTIPWVAIHAIDWTRYITGCEFQAVSAVQAPFGSGPMANVEMVGGILYSLSTGGAALISFDFLRPAAAATHGDDRFRVIGTEGELWGCVERNELRLLDKNGERAVALDAPPSLFERFVDALIDPERPMPMTAADGLASTEAALWAREAARRSEQLLLPR